MMQSSQSLFLNQVEMDCKVKGKNDPLLLGQVEFQVCSYIRLHTLQNQNRNVGG